MRIGELLREMPQARVLACTATATPVVRDICASLHGVWGEAALDAGEPRVRH